MAEYDEHNFYKRLPNQQEFILFIQDNAEFSVFYLTSLTFCTTFSVLAHTFAKT